MRAEISVIQSAIGIFFGLAAMLATQAAAQVYRPQGFDRADNAVQFEVELRSTEGLGAFGDLRRAKKEREEPWTLFGRLGIVSVENRAGHPEDGFMLKRGSGPGAGRLSFGIRKRF
jgi:hypothetical protein